MPKSTSPTCSRPPKGAAPLAPQLDHILAAHRSRHPFSGNAGLRQTDSEGSPLASEPFRRFIMQSGSSSKCVPPLPLACKYRFISPRWLACYWDAERQQQTSLQGKSCLLWCLTQAAKSFAPKREQPDWRVVVWVHYRQLPWWHNPQCKTPSHGTQSPTCGLLLFPATAASVNIRQQRENVYLSFLQLPSK